MDEEDATMHASSQAYSLRSMPKIVLGMFILLLSVGGWFAFSFLSIISMCGLHGCSSASVEYHPTLALAFVLLAGAFATLAVWFLPSPSMRYRVTVAAVAILISAVSTGYVIGLSVNGCPRSSYEQCVESLNS